MDEIKESGFLEEIGLDFAPRCNFVGAEYYWDYEGKYKVNAGDHEGDTDFDIMEWMKLSVHVACR